jgi:hypothetical protein
MSPTSLRGALRLFAIRTLLRLYPRAWRRRYGVEFVALVTQRPLSPLEVADVVRGAVDARRVASRTMTSRRVPVCSASSIANSAAPTAVLERWRNGWTGRRRDMTGKQQRFRCSFCGKRRDQVRRLIAGPGVYICDECVALCNRVIADGEHPHSCQQPEGARPAVQRQAAPWWQGWQHLVRRWLETRRTGHLQMTVRQLIAGAASSST